MKKTTILLCSMALIASGTTFAEQAAENIEFSLGGTVKTNRFFDDNDGGINAQLGYFLTDSFQVSARQYGFINSSNGSTAIQGASGIFSDYHFNMGKLQPFVGIGGLYSYGPGERSNSFDIGAEAGVKVFVLPKTFIAAQGTYFRAIDDIDNGHKAYALFSLSMGFDF